MFEELKRINKKLLRASKTPEEKKKYALISTLLKNDKCFFEMPIETSLSILKDLQIPEENLFDVYNELINKKEYDNLY